MKLFHMVRRGLVGRKRDTAILGSILFLAFLFLNLSSILLASFTETAQRQRQALHGNWQLLYYGAGDEAEARCAQFADCGAIRLLGSTKDSSLVGSADETVMELGGLQLAEGRLPQGEDEIVLVRGRMPQEPAVGEELQLAYLYDYMRGGSVNNWADREQAILDSVRAGDIARDGTVRPWEEVREEFLDYLRENYDPESNTIRFREGDGSNGYDYNYPLPPDYDLDRAIAEAEDELLLYWATVILHPMWKDYDAYQISTVLSYPGGLYGFENFLINVKNEGMQTAYTGWAFSEEVRQRFTATELQTAQTLIYKTYTVVGYLSPYADHWDVRGLSMPDAFVSPEAADAQLRAIRRAEEDYYEGAPTYRPTEILLLQGQDAAETRERALAVFSELQEPYFMLEGVDTENKEETGGMMIGLDPETGEKKICQIHRYGSVGYYLEDPATGTWRYISGNPDASVRWSEFSDILLPLQPETLTLEELENNNTYPLRLNQYSYPPSGSAEGSVQTLCSGVLIGVAACSVFQVFWVQLRRRRIRLTTLMSVGATDGQVFRMLLLEILVLLAVTGVLGVAVGFGLSKLLTSAMDTVFTVQWTHLRTGILCCVGAVLVSAMIPMLLVLRTPLTGREQVSRHTLRLVKPGKTRRQSYRRIVLRQLRVNRGRTALQLVMAWLLALICLLTVFLCHDAFSGYRRKVEDTGMPDYEILAPYGMSSRHLNATLAEAEALTRGSEVTVTKEAPNVWLHCDGLLEKSPIMKALSEQKEAESMFRRLKDGGTGFAVRVVGMEAEGLEALRRSLPEEKIDWEAVERGEACILLTPRYDADADGVRRRQSEQDLLEDLRSDELAGYLLSLHYAAEYRSVTEADTAIRPGDTVDLTAYSYKISDEKLREDQKDASLRVEAVLSTLDPPLWPVSSNDATHVIVTGSPVIAALYPSANTRMTAAQAKYLKVMAKLFYRDSYGLTRFNVTNREGTDPVEQDTTAYSFAESLGFDFVNQRLYKEREEASAQRRFLLFLLLGIEMALVVSTLLYSAAGMAAEQDRYRFGILQGIGVTEGQVFSGQALQAFALALAGCLEANLTMLLVHGAVALFSGNPKLTLLENLEGYPWRIHALVCGGFLLVFTLLQTLPIRRVSRVDPMENLRS